MKHCNPHALNYSDLFSSCPQCMANAPAAVQRVGDSDEVYHPHYGTKSRAELRAIFSNYLSENLPQEGGDWSQVYVRWDWLEKLRTETKPDFETRNR